METNKPQVNNSMNELTNRFLRPLVKAGGRVGMEVSHKLTRHISAASWMGLDPEPWAVAREGDSVGKGSSPA